MREPRWTTTCQGIGRIDTSLARTQPVRPFGRPGTVILYQATLLGVAATFATLPGLRFAGTGFAICFPIARIARGR